MSKGQYHQLPLSEWPTRLIYSGVVLSAGPVQINKQQGVLFSRGSDDLDEFDAAIVVVADSHVCIAIRYLRSQRPGTTLMFDSDINEAIATWRALKRCFRLEDRDCLTVDLPLRETPEGGEGSGEEGF